MSTDIYANKQTFSALIVGSMLLVGTSGGYSSSQNFLDQKSHNSQSVYIGSYLPSIPFSSTSFDITEYSGILNLMNNLIKEGEIIDPIFSKCINENFFNLLD